MRNSKSGLWQWSIALLTALLFMCSPHAAAITIFGNLVPAGSSIGFSGITATTAPSSVVGGGSLGAIFDTAAAYWDSAIFDNFTLTINYGWGNTGNNGTLALESSEVYAGTPERILEADIVIRSQNSPAFYAGATPASNSEYSQLSLSYANSSLCYIASNCTGILNTGIDYSGASGAAATSYDLLSVVMHEMGHALGLDPSFPSYQSDSAAANAIGVTTPLPFAGATIFTLNSGTTANGPIIYNAHLNPNLGNLGGALMQSSLATGVRRLPSTADILAVCQVSQFSNCAGQAITALPEPHGMLLSLGGVLLLTLRRRFWRAAS